MPLSSGQKHFVGGLTAMAISAAFVLVLLGWLIGVGGASCPADTGRVPVRTLDGRTLCVLPADLGSAR